MDHAPVVDCHVHVYDPVRFPFPVEGPGYRPQPEEAGTAWDLRQIFEDHGISHALVVQPSGYGTDHGALLAALAASKGRWKGIAMANPGMRDDEWQALADSGVVGVRFNLVDYDPRAMRGRQVGEMLARVRDLGWFVELHAQAAELPDCAAFLIEQGVRFIIDHIGLPDPTLGVRQMGFRDLLACGATGRAIVKLSGAFRASATGFPYADLDPFVRELVAAFGIDNCLWGSDWPFVKLTERPAYWQTLAVLERWVPDRQKRTRILWDNPSRLFGFTAR